MDSLGRWGWGTVKLLAGTAILGGCSSAKLVEPVTVANSTFGPITIAVAPALNLSGSTDFDPDRFADLMASELSYAEGVSVIPVSRVLGVLAAQGRGEVESASHALEVAALLGADAILVFAVAEYDPYDPPSIGISAQLYGARPRSRDGALDPVALSRQASLAASEAPASPQRLLAQAQRVFDASHESVAAGIREFAAARGAEDSPYGWRKYVVSQQHFIRYCCHATIRALLNAQGESVLVGGTRER
ncbi:MAG: hypothetical protein JSU86_14240 [Phycisphaerales bacterium]|nr:MAG: hypothetical protein JSU86_14240 [Phycisphaerales bacterium]